MRKARIITKNKDIYYTLKYLNLKPKVNLVNLKPTQLTRIIKNINKKEKKLCIEKEGKNTFLKKINPSSKLNIDVYLR